jgi:hypothetical protein
MPDIVSAVNDTVGAAGGAVKDVMKGGSGMQEGVFSASVQAGGKRRRRKSAKKSKKAKKAKKSKKTKKSKRKTRKSRKSRK